MKTKITYPLLEINLKVLTENTRSVVSHCAESGIEVSGVIKGCNGLPEVASLMMNNGCTSIASSRILQLRHLRELGYKANMMLIRLPMISEVEDVVAYADISLNSDKKTLEMINDACVRNNYNHKIILMFDLGDLREGVWKEDDFVQLAEYVEHQLSHVTLYGIGTNVGCYGSIRPTVKNMTRLSVVAEKIEERIQRKLDVVSGGATSSYPLVINKTMPSKINHLRIGEEILLGRDLNEFYNCNIEDVKSDGFTLIAQIVEIETKPSYPVGEIFIDAFGNKPHYEDIGNRKRALLAIGKQDFADHEKLIALEQGVKIVGSSSDHLIVDITDSINKFKVGDTMRFNMYYQPLLYLSLSPEIKKVFI